MKTELSRFAFLLVAMLCTVPGPAAADDLFRESSFRALTADRRAFRVGDVLTVLVVENSSASATAATKTDKSNDTAISVTSPKFQKGYGLGLEENFEGGGKISRSGRLLAQLSVNVTAIDVNGDYWIKGEQLVEINDEKQSINLEGRVRPNDIGENNTVMSNRIADARITYVGNGVLAESQHKGWLSRVLSFLGLI